MKSAKARASKRKKTTRPKFVGSRRTPTVDATRQHAALQGPRAPLDKKTKLEKKALTLPVLRHPRRTPTVDATRQHLALQTPKSLKRAASSRRRRPVITLEVRRHPTPNIQLQIPLPLETVGWIFSHLPLPLETIGEDSVELMVTLSVIVPVRAPLIVQFNIAGVVDSMDPLTVTLDIGDAINTGLGVTFDIVSGSVSALRSADVQAPVAQVTTS
jgi:hypothetical protein